MKHINTIYRLFLLFAIISVLGGCTEEISFKTENLESALVIEATITNEIKNHEILLSRTYKFEADGPIPEENATVVMVSESGTFNFTENESGKYVSTQSFSAQPGLDYVLKISTANGESYSSKPTRLTTTTDIGDLYAERRTNDTEEDGVSIFVDTYDPTGTSQYYRFEYEESYKVVAPKWRANDLVVIDPEWPACSVELVPKTDERRVCFATDTSNTLILGTTANLEEDRLSRFEVRRVNTDNYIIGHRYSILVRQYVQSNEAFSYFSNLQEFSESESLFSQVQPGFFSGNISSETNSEDKVIGFFELTYVSEKRIFFNYNDLFPGVDQPPYVSPCFEFAPVRDQGHPTDECGLLITALLNNEISYWMENPEPESIETGPYLMVPIVCGDCTELGSNVAPDFWVEE